jgi:CheY-like chemotaxis protein
VQGAPRRRLEERLSTMNPQSSSKKILVIDDEPDVVKYLVTLLEDQGYRTVAASDGKQGLEIMKAEKPDLVCLDITMPGTSGIRFFREAKQDPALASTPIVVVTAVTGYGGDPVPFKEFLESRKQVPPPDAFISKPIERESFLRTVGELLE